MAIIIDKKQIGVWSIVMLTLGNIVNSSGIAVMAGDGYSGILIFLASCFLFSLPCLIVSNFLAVHYKHDGGLYHWVYKAFGEKIAFLATWLQWISVIVSFPAFMTFNVGLLAYSINESWLSNNKLYIVLSSLFFVWFFTWITSKGIKGTAKLSGFNAIFSYLIPIGLLFIFALIWLFEGTPATHTPLTMHNVFPTNSMVGVLATLGVAVFMVSGLEFSGYLINYAKSSSVYKKGMAISLIIIVISPIIAIFAMLTLLPLSSISDSHGLMDAFKFFFNWMDFRMGNSIILTLYFLGQMAAVAVMLLFTSKAMEAVANAGILPKSFRNQNKHGISPKIMFTQSIVISAVIIAFTLIPSLSSAYVLIIVIVGISSIARYVLMFAAAGKIMWRLKKSRMFYITLVCAFIGGIFSVITFFVSFIPPIQNTMSFANYEGLLFVGVSITLVLPIFYLIFTKRNKTMT